MEKSNKPWSNTKEIETDENLRAYLNDYDTLKRNYLGQHVAYVDGRIVDHDENRDLLAERVWKQYPTKDILIQPVEETPLRVVRMRRPGRVIEE